jgi:mono/diheme cytochrome c family protein
MRHIVVRRTALLLGTIFLGGTVLFAWLVSPTPGASPAPRTSADGPRLFQAHCASCHTTESLRPSVSLDKRKELEGFLAAHGEATEAEDRLILEYLTAEGGPADLR